MAFSNTPQHRIVWGVRILLALAFAGAGVSKLMGVPQMVEVFEHIGIGQWFRYLTGLIEVTGVILLLIPSSGFFAGLLLGGIMVGAVATHLLVIGGSPVPALVLGALCAFVVYRLRPVSPSHFSSASARA